LNCLSFKVRIKNLQQQPTKTLQIKYPRCDFLHFWQNTLQSLWSSGFQCDSIEKNNAPKWLLHVYSRLYVCMVNESSKFSRLHVQWKQTIGKSKVLCRLFALHYKTHHHHHTELSKYVTLVLPTCNAIIKIMVWWKLWYMKGSITHT